LPPGSAKGERVRVPPRCFGNGGSPTRDAAVSCQRHHHISRASPCIGSLGKKNAPPCHRQRKREPLLVAGRHSHVQNEQLKRAHSTHQYCDRNPIVFEPMPAHCMHGRPSPLSDSPATLAHPYFRAISQERILVSRFVVKTRPMFRSLWRKSDMIVDAPGHTASFGSDAVRPGR
jgi:hypothetical protein